MNTPTYYSEMDSPIGKLTLSASAEGISGVFMENQGGITSARAHWQRSDERLDAAQGQLLEYFDGARTIFDLELDLGSGTDFQRRVWTALLAIPYGESVSYGEIARRIGQPPAVRAVGLANGRNPIAIIVPCHRVIGANGTLTGYGGGLDRKRLLLAHEQEYRQQPMAAANGEALLV